MKKAIPTLTAYLLVATFAFTVSCKKEKDPQLNPVAPPTNEPAIQGKAGNPRFNLQFTNQENVDLDLHVLTPNGYEIYYLNDYADNGQLDVDCFCEECPNGPNENIYWEVGTAPLGEYKFWVEYYDHCGNGGTSNYTLRLMENSKVLKTYTGSLSLEGETSEVYTYHFNGVR